MDAQLTGESPGAPGAKRPGSAGGALPAGLAEHPDYEILRELGRGATGVVYLAQNKLMGRMEALKVISGQQLVRAGVLDRVLAGIGEAARLHHPNIITAYSLMRLGEIFVLATEFVEGFDLARVVQAKGPLPLANACHYVQQAAAGLEHAHECGMAHFNIKPSNLMLTRQGTRPLIKIVDFGLSRAGHVLGTPEFLAPEQMTDSGRADIRADIYSLGCTFYFLLTGNPPFQGASLYDILQAHQSMEAVPLNLARPDVPMPLAIIVATMMAKEPERRFQTPAEVSQALAPFLKKEGPAPRGSSPEPPRPVASRSFELSQGTGVDLPTPPVRGAEAIPPPPKPPAASGSQWDTLIEVKPDDDLSEEVHTLREKKGSTARLVSSAVGVLGLVGLAVAVGMGLEARKHQESPAPPTPAIAAPAKTQPTPPAPAPEAPPPAPVIRPSPAPPVAKKPRKRVPAPAGTSLARNEEASRPAGDPTPEPPPSANDRAEGPGGDRKPPAGEPKPKPDAELTPEEILEKRGLSKQGRYYVVATENEYSRVWNSTVQGAINLMEAAWKDWNDALEVQAMYLSLSDDRDNLQAYLNALGLQMNGANRAQQVAIQNDMQQTRLRLNAVAANLAQVQKRLATPGQMQKLENTFKKQRDVFLAAKNEIEPVYVKLLSEYKALDEDEKVKGSLGVLGERYKVRFTLGPSEGIQRSVRTLKQYLEMVAANPDAVRGKRKSTRLKERPKVDMPKGK